ncbi:prenyltransferase/squalene oxidase repeat-containing protein [Streptomyces sp. NPDC051555]|uniref:prenyltransferase/squalene oxidase repeat-containing protein n=1 Tax=Streptomyces sp. NPDC051555 TaxID=3365657 RepID=UPI0037A670D9
MLKRFETPTHYACYVGEDTPSPTANAHVLEALGAAAPGDSARIAKISDWLAACQRPDGSWQDKWHASPYYAVACCAPAIHRYGLGTQAHQTVSRALNWLRDTRHPDGSWGVWGGTAEETAYALLTFARCNAPPPPSLATALAHLTLDPAPPALWHDKDLYCPVRIVHATIRAARHLYTQQRA